jgi:hypothetical protein
MWDDAQGCYVCEDCGEEMELCPGCTTGGAPDQQGAPYCPECDLSCATCGCEFQSETTKTTAGFGDGDENGAHR